MPERNDVVHVPPEGPSLQPQPDPWGPPGANYAQAASIATGATGTALLIGDSPDSTEVAKSAVALLPDPVQIFGGLAHVLGFQFEASDAWSWGIVLVALSVALNIVSLALRRRYAQFIEREQAANLARDAQLQASASASRAQGFIPGER